MTETQKVLLKHISNGQEVYAYKSKMENSLHYKYNNGPDIKRKTIVPLIEQGILKFGLGGRIIVGNLCEVKL